MAHSKKRSHPGRKQHAITRPGRPDLLAPSYLGAARHAASSAVVQSSRAPSSWPLIFGGHSVPVVAAAVSASIAASLFMQCPDFQPRQLLAILAIMACVGTWFLLITISPFSERHTDADETSQNTNKTWRCIDKQEERERNSHDGTGASKEEHRLFPAEGEENDDMRGSGRGPTQIGISWQ